ncbi:ComEC/Rec2 family competence protein [Clostridium sp. Cult2]|uniref:ComEC/Rec2 family competence protein n=1 Tax=Clostridium sp. Cult2 TaxID=2079003 RepID=UPI0023517701|nr:MBL fold metallo-hydrolase [Clostridium sp. Cult2]MCF6465892.1 MBL fold metallo-hydrolase [Clostridium sp. Cult2]
MKRYRFISFLAVFLIFSMVLTGCTVEIATKAENPKDYKDKLIVHFIDVGQGDSTFIQFPNGETSLIDGGSRQYGERVVNYIKDLGIEKIDYLIGTHPHEDHIGGLPEVVRNFKIGKVYMPNRTANTRIFEELLLEVDSQDLKIHLAKAKDYIIDDEQLKYYILAPNRDDYSETNDFSIVTKIEYMKNSFIIAGDAEESSELDMIKNSTNLKSDVLRIAHHGGRTSSNEKFLEKVNPKYSIISVGSDNSYGHPHRETLNRLKEIDTYIMRTDELGNIVLVSDGNELTHLGEATEKSSTQIEYLGNKNTKVYHSKDCNSLPKEENQIIFKSMKEAEENGYKPHDKCVKQGEIK